MAAAEGNQAHVPARHASERCFRSMSGFWTRQVYLAGGRHSAPPSGVAPALLPSNCVVVVTCPSTSNPLMFPDICAKQRGFLYNLPCLKPGHRINIRFSAFRRATQKLPQPAQLLKPTSDTQRGFNPKLCSRTSAPSR